MALKEDAEEIIKQGIKIGIPKKELEEFFKEENNNINIKLEKELPHLSESCRTQLAEEIKFLLGKRDFDEWVKINSEKAKNEIKKIWEDLNNNPLFKWDKEKEQLILYLTSQEEEFKLKNSQLGWGINGGARELDLTIYEKCTKIGLQLSKDNGKLYRYRCEEETGIKKGPEKLGPANDLEYIIYFPFLAEKAEEIVNELKELSAVASQPQL